MPSITLQPHLYRLVKEPDHLVLRQELDLFPEVRDTRLAPIFRDSGEDCEVGCIEVGDYLGAQFCGEVGDEVIVWVAIRLVDVDGC